MDDDRHGKPPPPSEEANDRVGHSTVEPCQSIGNRHDVGDIALRLPASRSLTRQA
jgi:hypothetical protein